MIRQSYDSKRIGGALPDKPSDLIELALADLEKVEATPELYRVTMGTWYYRAKDEKHCLVCLAGSVMAQTLGCGALGSHRSDWSGLEPSDFQGDLPDKLRALDYFRVGEVAYALGLMNIALDALPRDLHDVEISEYVAGDAEPFKADMRRLAADLREAGL